MDMERKKDLATSIFNFIGGLSGLLSLAALIFYGGSLAQKVQDHSRRIDNIELSGSMGLREHVKMDDERVNDVRLRTTRLEDAMMKLIDLNAEVKVMGAKIDSVKEQVGKLVEKGQNEHQTQNIGRP